MSNSASFLWNSIECVLKKQLQDQQRELVYNLSDHAFDIAKSSGDIPHLRQVYALRVKSSNFDKLVQLHFSQKNPKPEHGGVNWASSDTIWQYHSPHVGKWISELKIRYLTNEKLTEHKVEALLKVIRVYEDLYTQHTANKTIDYTIKRLEDVIGIQINTRFEEARIQTRVKELLELRATKSTSDGVATLWIARKNIESTADFIRDLTTLQALGFMAPQLSNMLASYTRHPNIELSESILSTHRSAMEAALLTFYWNDPRYFENFHAVKWESNAQEVPAIKWAATIPIEPPNIRGYDDRARDHNIGIFPTELIPVLSEYVREIVYDLTRKKAPSIRIIQQRTGEQKRSVTQSIVSFVFSRKRDPNRITLAQEKELARLRRDTSHS